MHRFIRPLVLASLLLALSAASFAGVFVSVAIGPPPIPVYTQPLCPGAGYMWTPGYWGYGDDGYYWVPGTWVMAPEVGLLWTPGYWGWSGGLYVWNGGYWGPHIGFYGGINYGFGYGGVGFGGGEWRGGNFYYNRSVTNVNVTNVTNVYNKTVVVNNNHTSFNGGTGGVAAKPTAQEQKFASEKHVEPTQAQTQHQSEAGKNPQMLAKNNGGKPAVAATSKPGEFSGKGVVAAKAAGGNVSKESLNATPKNASTPKANTSASAGAKGGASAGGSKPGATTSSTHNVPKPPNASSSTKGSAGGSTGGSHPSNTASSTHNTTSKPPTSSGPSHSTPPAHNTPPPSHSSPPPSHSSAPPQHSSAPPQHSSPPPQHSSPPPKNEKPHR